MGRFPSGSSFLELSVAEHDSEEPALKWPFGKIDSLSQDDLRETAYELFFASCRSSPGFGGRTPISYYSASYNEEGGGGGKGGGGGLGVGGGNTVVMSRIKRGLGLKSKKVSPPMRAIREIDNAGMGSPRKVKQRPMTCAEIMRQQMGVTEQSDTRLRKTLMRTLVGQVYFVRNFKLGSKLLEFPSIYPSFPLFYLDKFIVYLPTLNLKYTLRKVT